MNSEETMAIVVKALLWQDIEFFCPGIVLLLEREDWIIEQHIVCTAHSTVKGPMLADGAFAGPIFLSSRSCSELTRAAFLRE